MIFRAKVRIWGMHGVDYPRVHIGMNVPLLQWFQQSTATIGGWRYENWVTQRR